MAKNSIDISNSNTLNEIVPLIKRCIKADRPAFLWSGPGVGKSSIVAALAKELGGISIDIRLSQMQPTDILGIPFPVKNGEKTTVHFAPLGILPTNEMASKYPIVILFLDELNSAPPTVQSSAYQLVLDRRAGEYKLPDNVYIIAAGNREGDRGVTFRMPSPLKNRFLHFNIRHDFESFMDWAISAHIHPDVISYLHSNKGKLFDFDPNSEDNAFATPRSWQFVSELLLTDTEEDPMDESMRRTLVASAVGNGAATEFISYMKVGKKLPKPEDILSGKVTTLATKEISAQHQLLLSTLHEMREYWYKNSKTTGNEIAVKNGKFDERRWDSKELEKTWRGMFENFLQFVMNNLDIEVSIMAMRVTFCNYYLGKSTDTSKMSCWEKVTKNYLKYLKD